MEGGPAGIRQIMYRLGRRIVLEIEPTKGKKDTLSWSRCKNLALGREEGQGGGFFSPEEGRGHGQVGYHLTLARGGGTIKEELHFRRKGPCTDLQRG